MDKLLNKTQMMIPKLMMLFIAIQPLLDLSTSYSKLILESNVTPGIITRFLFIAIGGLYILVTGIKNKKYMYIGYLFLLALFFIINLFISYQYKPVFNLISEVTSIGKIVYFMVIFFVFLSIFNNDKKRENTRRYFPVNITISQLIISLSMLVSLLTNTNIEAYDGLLKSGTSGWFFAGNELGTLMAICYPILIWFAMKQDKKQYFLLGWIVILGSTFSLVILGTKVGYLAVFITLGLAIIAMLLELLFNKSIKKINTIF